MKNKAYKKYCRAVSSFLPCGRKVKKGILNQLRMDVAAFLEENPEADLGAIQSRFGTPQSVASAYVEAMDTAQLLNDLRIRRRIITAVMAMVVFVLTTWAGVVTWAIQYEIRTANAVIVETVTEYD